MCCKISIIVAVYNAEHYLTRCLDSIFCQTLKNLEVIAIDDFSSDRSTEILNSYSKRNNNLKIIRNIKNSGVGYSRNIAINKSKGEYIFILDADDRIKDENSLKKLYDFANKNNSDVVLFDYEVNNEKTGKKLIIKTSDTSIHKNEINPALYPPDKCLMNSWCRLYKRDFLTSKNIKFGIGNHGEDHIFSLKSLYEASKISYFPEVCYVYSERSGSVTNSQDDDNFQIFENIELVESYLTSYKFWDSIKKGFYRYRLKTLKTHCLACSENFRFSFVDKAKSTLSEKEFRKFVNSLYPSIWQRMFSITNVKDKDSCVKHKILTVLGRQFVLNPGKSPK